MEDPVAKIRQECWDQALHTFATAHIFERRARSLRWRLRALTFLGIAVPATVGGVIIAFGTNDQSLLVILWLAGILGLVQLIGSIWALVAKWDDAYAYALESIAENHRFSNSFASLGKNPPAPDELRTRQDFLEADNGHRRDSDYKQGITEEEKRRGMRAGLLQFRRTCVACGEIPVSLRASDCGVCGQF